MFRAKYTDLKQKCAKIPPCPPETAEPTPISSLPLHQHVPPPSLPEPAPTQPPSSYPLPSSSQPYGSSNDLCHQQ
ncbi:hypothetical protein GBAR_LOCUS14855 [Geodia barretti]|nr:hypothetical protein GBAR_LOCUS14855 [Geodia barretti]